MAAVADNLPRNRLADGPQDVMGARTVPILSPNIQLSVSSPGEPMDITTPPAASAAPLLTKSPDSDTTVNGGIDRLAAPSSQNDQISPDSIIMPAPAAAAPAVHQPKIVQTAFIHKLYNMLEDKSIQHLISWSPSADSFVMHPCQEFAKVLAQYFKHTNISSFVRQLNMYGFHKVSDVFHHGTPDSALWEFKHGNGSFRRGDLVGLREIKRRASRHALVHREYNPPKPPAQHSQPGTPAEPMAPPMPEGGEPRMNMEHVLYDLSARLQRSEENSHVMQIRQHAMMDNMIRLLQFSRDISRAVLTLTPGPEHPVHQNMAHLQGDIQRQLDLLRSADEPAEPLFSNSRSVLSHAENAPMSPRQMPQDDSRRPSHLGVPPARPPNDYRPTVPSNLSISTRRPYGSIGGTTQSSPSSLRTHLPPPSPGPHPMANVEPPSSSLARRHTSADIRACAWQPAHPPPFVVGPSPTPWPSSPSRGAAAEDQRIRDSFTHYSLQAASQPRSRPHSPPPPPPFMNGGGGPPDTFGSWSWNKANSRESIRVLGTHDISAPPTRRGSMAHILNPTDGGREESDLDFRGEDDRKRKRLQ